jgi:hypothetical protein
MRTKKQILFWTLMFSGAFLAAQETGTATPVDSEPVEPVLELTYLKDTWGKVNLRASMVRYVDRMPVPLPGLEITFYAGEDSLVSLGNGMTDPEGHAVLVLEEMAGLPRGEDGSVRYVAEYEGNDDIRAAEYEIYITDVNLAMSLDLVDSVGTVSLRAYTLVDGMEVPVADEDVYVYVSRMFSDLPVGEDFLDENGAFTTEVPPDIPGDASGNIEIVARFNDHYLFGTVEKRQIVQWGVPTSYDFQVPRRTLWTQIAPLWMIITLSIMLIGVWSHYIYVIVQLIRLRRMARKEEPASLV